MEEECQADPDNGGTRTRSLAAVNPMVAREALRDAVRTALPAAKPSLA